MSSMRYKYKKIFDFMADDKQMIFISGPRQAGKTTFVKERMQEREGSSYINWDVPESKKLILQKKPLVQSVVASLDKRPFVILDEIHKYNDWKNYLKGIYDRDADFFKFIITGSGRLDFYRKGKDSLAGRYFLFHMWPLTLCELTKESKVSLSEFIHDPFMEGFEVQESTVVRDAWRQLSQFGGFPDPFFKASQAFYNIWSDTYRNQLIREDVRELTRLEKIDQIEELMLLLPSKVGSPISMNNLAHDIGVSFDTIKKWLMVLERFYLVFRIPSWSEKISRSITREKKLFLFNYAEITDPGARFENMVALELLRATTSWREQGMGAFELFYVRDRSKNEIDFLITKNRNPLVLVEAKKGDKGISEGGLKLQRQLQVPLVVLNELDEPAKFHFHEASKVLVTSAFNWISKLP